MAKKHENYKELIWALAKTDFKLRYHGSFLGYVWALLKPLLMFAILYFVFSSIFNPRGLGSEFYALQLLTGIILYNFFSEGTMAGMASLVSKSQLVTKIYVPRWTIIVASTLSSALIFFMNLIILVALFAFKQFLPSFESVMLFFFFILAEYTVIISFSLIAAPLYVRFRDLSMIWEVVILGMFYATPIIYPLQVLPFKIEKLILINPLAFIIHFSKEGLINNHFSDLWKTIIFITSVVVLFLASILIYKKSISKVAENI